MKNQYSEKIGNAMNHQCYLFQFVFFISTFLLHLPQNVSTLSLDNEVEGSFFERTEALQQKKLSIANQKGHVVKDKKTDAPLAVHGLNFRVEGVDDPKTVADIFVLENMNSLRVENARNVRDHKIRATLAGSVVRYKQICNNIDVLESEIAVTVSKDNAVTFSAGSFRPNIQCPDTIPKFSKDDAINAASDEIGIPHKDMEFVEANLIIFMDGTESILTWQVRICGIKQRYESNEYIYNALNGDLIRAKSMISDKNGYEHLITHQSSSTSSINRKDRGRITKRLRGSLQQSPDVFFSKLEKRVSFPRMDENETNTTRKDGFAYIFEPNPLATAKAKYTDPGFGDNCGFNSAELKKQLRNVTLQGLLFERNTYYLNGKYAQYHNFDLPSPFQIPFLGIDFDTESKSSSPDFSSDRRHGRFEATNAFYSIEKYLRYVEEDLGIQIKPTLYDGGIRFDPRGAFGLDNSYYDTISQRLAFGEGGVDDSEDDDVVVHELGHFIHDILTDGSVSTLQGLSEVNSV